MFLLLFCVLFSIAIILRDQNRIMCFGVCLIVVHSVLGSRRSTFATHTRAKYAKPSGDNSTDGKLYDTNKIIDQGDEFD